mmetsp:Transcript_87619/g.154585  ORF Transcript_87619/g.154585 Transcript_87619/m.154585 type:complete len:130 (-) Transcript_87619:124-513(-)
MLKRKITVTIREMDQSNRNPERNIEKIIIRNSLKKRRRRIARMARTSRSTRSIRTAVRLLKLSLSPSESNAKPVSIRSVLTTTQSKQFQLDSEPKKNPKQPSVTMRRMSSVKNQPLKIQAAYLKKDGSS